MRDRIRALGGFAWAVFAVLSAVSLAFWGHEVVASKHHHPLNFWLVVTFALVGASGVVWGLRQRGRAAPQAPAQHFHAPVTINMAPGASPSNPFGTPRAVADTVGPATVGGPKEIVRLMDYAEMPHGLPAMIRGRRFQNVTLQGPIVVAPLRVQFLNVVWGITANDIESILIEIEPDKPKLGLVGLEDCIFEDCHTDNVAIAGTAEILAHFRSKMASEGQSPGTGPT